MDMNAEVQDLLSALGPEDPGLEDLAGLFDGVHARHGGSAGVEHDQPARASVFSQLLERLVQGYRISFDDEGEDDTNLEILLDSVPESVLILDTAGSIQRSNQAFRSTFGYLPAELETASIFDFLPEAYRADVRERIAGFAHPAAEGRPASPDDVIAFRGHRRDGSTFSMDCLLTAVRLGGHPAVLALIRDLSFDRALIAQLRESKEHYVALSETITEAIFRIDEDFTILFANSGVKSTFGFDRDEVLGRHFGMLFPPEVYGKHEEEFRKYFVVDDRDRQALGLRRTFEVLGITKHRGVSPMEMSFGNSKEHRGRTLTCVVRDITQRKTLERRLRHLAYHDKLTGLGNRDLFGEDMAVLARKLETEPDWQCGLLFLDLDGFKQVNDTLGHDAGDLLLVETARRLRVCLRERDHAYRFGGDEFVVVLPGIHGPEDAEMVASRILAAVQQPYRITRGKEGRAQAAVVGVSIGMSLMPLHGRTVDEATRCADVAMYSAKEAGKNRCSVYDEKASERSMMRWRLDQELKASLGKGGFSMVYQPIVGPDGVLRGMEALVRWRREGGESVSPAVFIPIAEENGLIVPLGEWSLRRACHDLRRLQERGHRGTYVSVNVSSRQFERSDFEESVAAALASSGLDPAFLKLELTETAVMRETERTIDRMRAIKVRFPGISFMVDDFGTGYSSLAYLSRLPVDALKIDISFVVNLRERQNEKVVNAIINLGRSLELDLVAEGIETEEQRAWFAGHEGLSMQGYFFQRPAPVEEICTLLERDGTREAPAREAIARLDLDTGMEAG